MLSRKTTKISVMLLLVMLMVSMVLPFTAFASETPGGSGSGETTSDTLYSIPVPDGVKKTTAINTAMEKVSIKYGGTSISSGTVNNTMIYTSKGVDRTIARYERNSESFVITKDWEELKDKEKTKAMRTFVDALQDSDVDENALHEFLTNLQDSDSSVGSILLPMIMESTKADLYQAYNVVKPFLDVLNVILGVGCVLLILLLLFSTVMDLAYIGLPVWREQQANKSNGKHPFGVSYEALTTVQEIEKGIGGGDGNYKNSYILYFKRRALTYIVLALCIMYLICGGISGIIAFVLSLTSGMV